MRKSSLISPLSWIILITISSLQGLCLKYVFPSFTWRVWKQNRYLYKQKRSNHLGNLGVHRIALKWDIKKVGVMMCTEFIRPWTGFIGGRCLVNTILKLLVQQRAGMLLNRTIFCSAKLVAVYHKIILFFLKPTTFKAVLFLTSTKWHAHRMQFRACSVIRYVTVELSLHWGWVRQEWINIKENICKTRVGLLYHGTSAHWMICKVPQWWMCRGWPSGLWHGGYQSKRNVPPQHSGLNPEILVAAYKKTERQKV